MAPSKGRKNTKKKPKTQQQCVVDDEMQIRTATKSSDKTVTKSAVTNTIPSTVPKNNKESDVSVCTGLTSDETEQFSVIKQRIIDDSSSSDKKKAAMVLAPPPLPETSKTVIFDKDIPLQTLGNIETDIVIKAVTDIIYPTCRFVAQQEHLASAICYILKKIGYGRPDQDKERTKRWACTTNLVMETITNLRNRTLERYRSLAKVLFEIVMLSISVTISSNIICFSCTT